MEGGEIFAVRDFMLHLALRDDGGLEFQGLGERTHPGFEKAYPFLSKVLCEEPEPMDEHMRAAAGRERKRIAGRRKRSSTDIGRRVQAQLDAPAILVDRLVEETAKNRLKEFKPAGKPH